MTFEHQNQAFQQPNLSPSPWHRMKWTDNMVHFLLQVVHSIDIECPEQQHKEKKSSSSSLAVGIQLKKGKWKSVSKAMMEKGFHVSPQQCEDKFNDLNKRYKRFNELLGKGMACKVVQNPSFLDSMDYLPHKAKEEARKLLSSKHLFFREMCAYHDTCPSASAVSPATIKIRKDDVVDDEEEEDGYEEEESDDGSLGVKRKALMSSPAASSPSGSSSGQGGEQQQRDWLRMKAAELEEQMVVYQNTALELEKQRFNWLRFSSKKEREMEKTRLRNERMRLQNERMLLLLQQKEIRLLESVGNNGNSNAS